MARIKGQNVYFDKKSVEWNKQINKKYKLAGYPTPLSGVSQKRLFWILTSQRDVYPKERTVIIEQRHWENRDSKSLVKEYGYLCPDHREEMSNDEIKAKRDDTSNGFKFAARLCDSKFAELLEIIKKLKLTQKLTVPEWTKMVASVTTPENINEILKELHLQ